jgi:hypothetical protein
LIPLFREQSLDGIGCFSFEHRVGAKALRDFPLDARRAALGVDVYHEPASVDLDGPKRRVVPILVHPIARLAPRQGRRLQFARGIHRGVGQQLQYIIID